MHDIVARILSEDVRLGGELSDCIDKGRIHILEKDGECIGFFTWLEIEKNDKRYIFVNNLFILPEHRRMGNLLFLRRWFKVKFPKLTGYFYWHSQKHDRYFRIKEKDE